MCNLTSLPWISIGLTHVMQFGQWVPLFSNEANRSRIRWIFDVYHCWIIDCFYNDLYHHIDYHIYCYIYYYVYYIIFRTRSCTNSQQVSWTRTSCRERFQWRVVPPWTEKLETVLMYAAGSRYLGFACTLVRSGRSRVVSARNIRLSLRVRTAGMFASANQC